jgi:hypothetical protein
MPKPYKLVTILLATVIVVGGGAALGQSEDSNEIREAPGEFQFVRLAYNGNRYAQSGRGQAWRTDWPDAEHHFLKGVNRLTAVDAADDGLIMIPLDADIYDYPWIYAVEVGYWFLNDQEAARLRDYLLRGGFLMVDDFHGSFEWAMFKSSMDRVFPDRPIWERDGITPHWRGIYDDQGRLMVAINHNMDIGDAWEHADWPDYPENMTALAYRFGINYLIYAMTH